MASFIKWMAPAIEYTSGDGTWYRHGPLHRVDGPAVDWLSKNYFVYYVNGEEYIKEVFERIMMPVSEA